MKNFFKTATTAAALCIGVATLMAATDGMAVRPFMTDVYIRYNGYKLFGDLYGKSAGSYMADMNDFIVKKIDGCILNQSRSLKQLANEFQTTSAPTILYGEVKYSSKSCSDLITKVGKGGVLLPLNITLPTRIRFSNS